MYTYSYGCVVTLAELLRNIFSNILFWVVSVETGVGLVGVGFGDDVRQP